MLSVLLWYLDILPLKPEILSRLLFQIALFEKGNAKSVDQQVWTQQFGQMGSGPLKLFLPS